MTPKPNVLVITPQYAPDFGPSAPIYTSLCEDLARMGCNVTVITGVPHYGGAERFFSDIPSTEILNGVRVFRENVLSDAKGSFTKRILYHVTLNFRFGYSAFLRMKRNPIHVVLADAPFLWSGIPIFTSAIFPKRPFIYIVHDIFPDVLARLGTLRNRAAIWFMDRIERYFYSRAFFVSVLSSGFKRNLMGKGVPENKISIIPSCVDTEFIKPLSSADSLRTEWGLEGKFIVLYSGNIGLSQDLDTLLSVASRFRTMSNLCFVIVGEGVKKQHLQARAAELGLHNLQFRPLLPREMVPALYSTADVSLVLLNREIEVESVPSKTFTIMASGRPIIAAVGENSEVEHLLKVSECGIRVSPCDESALYDAILKLYEDKELRSGLGKSGRNYVLQHYSKNVAAKKYRELITNCIERERNAASI
jgi:colanic acid biosynthesis glycosyl transferase WcaI